MKGCTEASTPPIDHHEATSLVDVAHYDRLLLAYLSIHSHSLPTHEVQPTTTMTAQGHVV